jgi:hypothetical protein
MNLLLSYPKWLLVFRISKAAFEKVGSHKTLCLNIVRTGFGFGQQRKINMRRIFVCCAKKHADFLGVSEAPGDFSPGAFLARPWSQFSDLGVCSTAL